jgi:HK97 family phage major capsid protein
LKVVEHGSDVGLNEKEVRQFSFIRAINALANPSDRKAQEAAAFEFECSRAVAEVMKKSAQGIMVPVEVLRRDMVVGTDASGGYMVATDLLAANFIELLRSKMMTRALGAITLGGLVGDVAIPKQTGGATAYWVAESGAPTESTPVLAQLALTPKTCGAFTDISRKLLKQSSIDAEAFVRSDLAACLALALDAAGIAGTGASNQPRGILSTTGIGDVACGDPDGAAPVWGDIIGLETEVAVDNADVGALAYLTNAKARGKLKQVEKSANTGLFVWENGIEPGFGLMNGYRAAASNQVPSDLTKGGGSALSAIIFGNWADLIYGLWGTVDITVDPYTNSTSGTVRVVALQDADVGVRHAESFAAAQDAVTT